MSLIADALKTAQREKQRRESTGAPVAISPILVPVRSQRQHGLDMRRTLTMVISSAVTVVAIAVMVQRLRKTPQPLVAIPPVVSASTSTDASAVQNQSPAAGSGGAPASVARSAAARRVPTRPNVTGTSGRPQVATRQQAGLAGGTTLQGQNSAETTAGRAAASAAAETRPPPQPGRLSIALDEPRLGDAGRLFAEALTAHRAGQLETASELYERLLRIAPDHADALNNLGILVSGRRQFDRALELLRRAASIAPQNAGTWNNIGTALREQGGHSSDAVAAYRHALTLDPRHLGAKVGLAQQYLAMGSIKQARGLLEEVIASDPSIPEAYHALGQALELQGDRSGAIRAYSAFIRLAPARLADHVERTRRHVDSLSASAP